jgi:hypothetical protein
MKYWNQNAQFSSEVEHVRKCIVEATYLGVDFTNMLKVQNF